MKKTITYDAEQLFSNLDEDKKTVDFVIPEYILKKLGIKQGDKVRIQVLENGNMLIKREQNGQE